MSKQDYVPTIGLEIHAELSTKTKMFCSSRNNPDEKRPNVDICPVCMGHPGTLPVINKKAVWHVLRIGAALGGKLADFTEFDRKNYFYPDLPKGYQISQYKFPLVSGGVLRGVAITRVHLEEDTARSTHDVHETETLIDFNRAGIPLMELVTEPVIASAKEARAFAQEFQLLLRYLGASGANMEKGEMRVEANVSVLKDGKRSLDRSAGPGCRTSQGGVLGTKVEVKNLNSFRVVERAIEYEIERHIELLEKGEKVVQETRGWDEKKEATFSQREKEESHDYRYFPEPDLPKLQISEIPDFRNIEEILPELPWQKRERYKKEFGIKTEDIESYVANIPLGEFFETVVRVLKNDKGLVRLASNYITSDIAGILKTKEHLVTEDRIGNLEATNFAKLITMSAGWEVSSRGVKNILPVVIDTGVDVAKLAEEQGLLQKSDEAELRNIVDKVIQEHRNVVADFKAGKEKSLQFLIGQGMKETKGSANPQILSKLFKELIQ